MKIKYIRKERVIYLYDCIIISGSPAEISETEQVLKYLGLLLIEDGFSVKHISVKDIPPETLFTCNNQCPKIKQITSYIENAQGIIIGSPVLQGSFSGVLKAFLDLFSPNIFERKPIFPIMTGKSPDYHFTLEYSFKPLLSNLKGVNIKGVYILDEQIDKFRENPIINEGKLQATKDQFSHFIDLIPSRSGKIFYFDDLRLLNNEWSNKKSRKPIN